MIHKLKTEYENLQLNEEIPTVMFLYVLVLNLSYHKISYSYYPATKSEGYSFGVVRASVRPSIPSVRPSVRPSGTISQYLLVRFDSFLVQMISTMDSQTSNKFGQNQPLNT